MKSFTQTHFKWLLLFAVVAALVVFGSPHHDAATIGMIGFGLSTAAPFPVTPEHQAIALAYRNKKMIADEVLPRSPVYSESFRFDVYQKGEFLSITDTRVGRKSKPNEVEFTGTDTSASTNDEGLDGFVPQSDINKAASLGMPDPVGQMVEWLTGQVQLKREQRVASIVHSASTYAAGNKSALSGEDQWSDYTNSSPLKAIVAAMDGMFFRPNVAVMGQAVSSVLRMHPKIVKSYNGSLGDDGMVPLQFLTDLLELDKILVGQAFANTTKKGQTASLARLWGKHFALLYQDPMAGFQNPSPTFGLTAQYGLRVAGSKEDSDIGLRGGQKVRSGESVKELVIANDLGYLFENAVA